MRKIVMASVVLLTGLFAAASQADETKIALDKMPKVVVDAVKKRFPKGTLDKEGVKDVENGKTSYEVAVKDGKDTLDVSVTSEGVITGMEKLIELSAVPKIVADAVEKKYPKSKATKAEEIIKVADGKETLEQVEVYITASDGRKHAVFVDLKGEIKTVEDLK